MKDNKALIQNTKKEIQELQDQQNILYDQMIKIINPPDHVEGWLWDYCFNCSDNDGYTKRVEKEIYGS